MLLWHCRWLGYHHTFITPADSSNSSLHPWFSLIPWTLNRPLECFRWCLIYSQFVWCCSELNRDFPHFLRQERDCPLFEWKYLDSFSLRRAKVANGLFEVIWVGISCDLLRRRWVRETAWHMKIKTFSVHGSSELPPSLLHLEWVWNAPSIVSIRPKTEFQTSCGNLTKLK